MMAHFLFFPWDLFFSLMHLRENGIYSIRDQNDGASSVVHGAGRCGPGHRFGMEIIQVRNIKPKQKAFSN